MQNLSFPIQISLFAKS